MWLKIYIVKIVENTGNLTSVESAFKFYKFYVNYTCTAQLNATNGQRQVFPLPVQHVYVECQWRVSVSTFRGQHEVRFCPSGPSDVHIHWLINGHSLDTPIMEYRRPLGQREVLVSSWLREGPLIKDARYHCVAEASTGNDMSEVDLRLTIGGIWCCVDVKMSSVQNVMDLSTLTICIRVLKPIISPKYELYCDHSNACREVIE